MTITRTQLELIAAILQQAGFSTLESASSEDATIKLMTHQPDAIGLEVVLPLVGI